MRFELGWYQLVFLCVTIVGCSPTRDSHTERSSTPRIISGGRLAVPAHTEPTVRLVVSTPEPGFTESERLLAQQTLERIRIRLQPMLEQPLKVQYDKELDLFVLSKREGFLVFLHTPRRREDGLHLSVTTRGLLQRETENVVQEEMKTFAEAMHAREIYINEEK